MAYLDKFNINHPPKVAKSFYFPIFFAKRQQKNRPFGADAATT